MSRPRRAGTSNSYLCTDSKISKLKNKQKCSQESWNKKGFDIPVSISNILIFNTARVAGTSASFFSNLSDSQSENQ